MTAALCVLDSFSFPVRRGFFLLLLCLYGLTTANARLGAEVLGAAQQNWWDRYVRVPFLVAQRPVQAYLYCRYWFVVANTTSSGGGGTVRTMHGCCATTVQRVLSRSPVFEVGAMGVGGAYPDNNFRGVCGRLGNGTLRCWLCML